MYPNTSPSTHTNNRSFELNPDYDYFDTIDTRITLF